MSLNLSISRLGLSGGGGNPHPFSISFTGLSLISQQKTANTFTTTKDFSVTAVAGERIVFVVSTLTANAVTSIVVDPGGGNEIATTIRTSGTSNNVRMLIADVVWPATGTFTVRLTWAASTGETIAHFLNAKSLNFVDASNAAFTGVNPSSVTQSINTTVGQSVLFVAGLNTQTDVDLVQGVDELVGAIQTSGTRGFYLARNNAVAGGTPQAFQLTWESASFLPGHAALGVYG